MSLSQSMTFGGVAYTYYETRDGDKCVFHGANHDDTTRQIVEFIRTSPKRSGVNYGVRRGFIRFTEDRSVTYADGSTALKPSVSSQSINWPVGVADPDAVVMNELEKLFTIPLHEQGDTLDDTATTAGVGAQTALGQIAAFFTDGVLVG